MTDKNYYPKEQRTVVDKRDFEQFVGVKYLPQHEIKKQSDEYLEQVINRLGKILSTVQEHDVESNLNKLLDQIGNNDPTFDRLLKPIVKQEVLSIGKVGVFLRERDPKIGKDRLVQFQSELWHFHDEIQWSSESHIESRPDDQHNKDLWEKFLYQLRVYCMIMNGNIEMMELWYRNAHNEYKDRHPELFPEQEVKEITFDDFTASMNSTDFLIEDEAEYWGLVEENDELIKRTFVLETLLNRAERVLSGQIELTSAERDQLQEDIREETHKKAVNSTWKLADKENIRLLTQVAKPEGKTFAVQCRRRHFKRNLALRYGINIMTRDVITFQCTRLAWANNYWGFIKGQEDKGEVIISLWVNKQNKGDAKNPDFESDDAYDYFFDAKTTLVGKQHGDRYLELERKYAPLNADYEGYDIDDLLKAHKSIMAELMK